MKIQFILFMVTMGLLMGCMVSNEEGVVDGATAVSTDTNDPSLTIPYQFTADANGCGDIFLYQGNEEQSAYLTVNVRAHALGLSTETVTLEITADPTLIAVKIDDYGESVTGETEFLEYCNDIAPVAKPDTVWTAVSGALTITLSDTPLAQSCLRQGTYTASAQLENVILTNGSEEIQLESTRFEQIAVGWCAG